MDQIEEVALARTEKGLPKHFYFQPEHYQRELEAIWYNHWIYVCRSEEIAEPRDYQVVRIGDESVILTRNLERKPRAFYNTCRHRGSVLCTEERGRFKGKTIVCPYHQWAYSFDGELVGTPHRLEGGDFRREDYPLYEVAAAEWAGFVFVNLSSEGQLSLPNALNNASSEMANWKLEELQVGHRTLAQVACNWKIFWENFSECLHCPNLHPELSQLVPIYKKGLLTEKERPDFEPPLPGEIRPVTPLRDGAVTWTLDGQTKLPLLEGLTEEERERGQTYATNRPNFFLVAHIDYVRVIRLMPLGPESIELSMEWLFHPSALERDDFDLEHATALGELVSAQDRRACELNQRGLHSRAHHQGVLVRQEYGVYAFQSWVREQLASRTSDHAGGETESLSAREPPTGTERAGGSAPRSARR